MVVACISSFSPFLTVSWASQFTVNDDAIKLNNISKIGKGLKTPDEQWWFRVSHWPTVILVICVTRNPSQVYLGEKWNESGFRPLLCTYRLNWARRTSWGWWDDWDDTVLQTQDSKFEPWRSEAEHATSRSRRLPTILTFTRGWRRNIFCFFQTAETGNRTPNSGVKGSGANHYPRAPATWEKNR